jgi:tetratricopeptide (TPR) repeat protein
MFILFWSILLLLTYGGSYNNLFLNADLNIKSVSHSSKNNKNNNNNNEFEFNKLYKKAVAAIRTDDFITCVANLELAISLVSTDIDATQLLGTAHMKLGNYEQSILYLEKAVNMDKWGEGVIIANYIEGLRLCSQFEKASEVARKALQLHPDSIQIIFNSAILSFDLNNYNDCFTLFKKTLEIDQNHVDAWLRGIELLLQATEFELAESWSRQAILIFPDYFYFRYLLGNSFHHRERYDEALVHYQESAKLNPDHYMTNSNLGALYQSLGQADDAIKYYEKLMPFKRDDAGKLKYYYYLNILIYILLYFIYYIYAY